MGEEIQTRGVGRIFSYFKLKQTLTILIVFFVLITITISIGNEGLKERFAQKLVRKKSVPTDSVAIFGGAGYIGSYLSEYLRNAGFHVVAYDKNPSINDFQCSKMHSESVLKDEIENFKTIIFLGGCTGRMACGRLPPETVYQENVQSVINLVKKMNENQHFIAASTSAIMEGTFEAIEEDSVAPNHLDEYSKSLFIREIKLKELITTSDVNPRVSLFRFGTVVGSSMGQRTDLMFPSFFRAAYSTGIMKVQGFDTMRSFLSLRDLSRAFEILLKSNSTLENLQTYQIWHLASFSATVLKVATTISSMTGAKVDISPNDKSIEEMYAVLGRKNGFSLNCMKFSTNFNFTFEDSLQSVVESFDSEVPESIIPKGPHTKKNENQFMKCPVCGSTDSQEVLDLGSQPLANDFVKDRNVALSSPKFPLKLLRCKVCNHYHLSDVVDREDLFTNYLYQSGTSKTLSDYFSWLAEKVIKESSLKGSNSPGNILEIACNDGSQLDKFMEKNWNTYGVDPAKNLVEIAVSKGHVVRNGFWPLVFPELPKGEHLHAIVAQNVLAHVPDVISFLKGCVAVMGKSTMLYIQTSQCNMQQLGQFDTVYHEHISFFTGHSFMKAAELAGLRILSFETTPIHGESCFVTMQLDKKMYGSKKSRKPKLSKSMKRRLKLETKYGITNDFFATKFDARAKFIRDWLRTEILDFKHENFTVGAYGAAAKGMVLLHFLLEGEGDGTNLLDFVLDDAILKKDTFCPGTYIPVTNTEYISQIDTEKQFVLVIFAWNFIDEIIDRLSGILKGSRQEIFILQPFPRPKTIRIHLNIMEQDVIHEMPYNPTMIPNPIRNPKRKRVYMVTHQRNEEMMMPFFILQHSPLFDGVTLIDYESTDRTRTMIESFAPPSWRITTSKTGSSFAAIELDEQVMSIEKSHPDEWHIALTTTEFLVTTHLRKFLFENYGHLNITSPGKTNIQALCMTGDDSKPLKHFTSLPKQRSVYPLNSCNDGGYARSLHIGTTHSYRYSPGRHQYIGKGAKEIRG